MSETTKSLSGTEYRVTHTVGPRQAGIRLDRFLMERYRRRSREQLKRAIESGAVTIDRGGPKHLNLGKIKASSPLFPGDVISVLSVRKPEPPVNFNYKILFEDDAIAVIEKPPNLPVHPAGRFFFHTLLVHLKTRGFTLDLEAERKFYLVHRIDKETSGILLLAKTKEACNLLTQQFRNRETEKTYLALVKGTPKAREFTVDQPIGKNPKGRIGLKMYPLPESEGGLPSLTRFEVVEQRGDVTLLKCFPKTGRQHQIRAHADIAGFPLVGDKVYGLPETEVLAILDAARDLIEDAYASLDPVDGDSAAEGSETSEDPSGEAFEDSETFEIPGPTVTLYPEMEARLRLPRHALHAAGLSFTHPTTGQRMEFNSGLPPDLQEFFDRL